MSIVGQLKKILTDNTGGVVFSQDTPILSSSGTHSVMQTKICEEDEKEEQNEKQEPLKQNEFTIPEVVVNKLNTIESQFID